jgi:nitrogen regulatory protein PII
MKLLIITAVKEFEKEIKQLLKKATVESFSYQDVKGFKNNKENGITSNWFGSEMNETESILFYAFTAKEKVATLFDLVEEFNTNQDSLSHLHISMLNIEKTNNL